MGYHVCLSLIHNLSVGGALTEIYLLGVSSQSSHWEVQLLQMYFCYLILINIGQFLKEHGQGQKWVSTGEFVAC